MLYVKFNGLIRQRRSGGVRLGISMKFHIPDLYRWQVCALAFCHGRKMSDARVGASMTAVYDFIYGSWITRAPESEHCFSSADDKNILDGGTPPTIVCRTMWPMGWHGYRSLTLSLLQITADRRRPPKPNDLLKLSRLRFRLQSSRASVLPRNFGCPVSGRWSLKSN